MSDYPWGFEVICRNCGQRFGAHTGISPHYWCPGSEGYGSAHVARPYFEPPRNKGEFPKRPTAEEIYEAIRGT